VACAAWTKVGVRLGRAPPEPAIQTVERIVTVLQRVSADPRGVTLSELARDASLAPATCHRLLAALADTGMVERDDRTKRWRPSVGLVRIAAAVSPSAGFGSLVDPVLEELRDRWGACFYASNITDGEVVCVRSVQAPGGEVGVPLGRRMALHATAAAKAILAHVPEDEARRLLEGAPLEPFTRHTLTSIDGVLADLAETRMRGFATCDQETQLGVAAYAATIAAPPGESPRSLGVIGRRTALGAQMRAGLLDALLTAAEDLSDATGASAQPFQP
jgi:IclR family acetate operon transcriptional repressor